MVHPRGPSAPSMNHLGTGGKILLFLIVQSGYLKLPTSEINCRARFPVMPFTRPLLKPMMHVTPEGVKFSGGLEERHSLQDSQWFVRSDLRSLARSASASYNGTNDKFHKTLL